MSVLDAYPDPVPAATVMAAPEAAAGHGSDAACGGKRRQPPYTPCTRPAGWGTNHPGIGRCKFHAGSTPSHVAAARRLMGEQAVATLGLPREVDPHQALLEEVHRTAGHVGWLSELVGDLDPLQLRDDASSEVAVWVKLYQQERTHLVRVTRAAIECGLAEREVQLAEREGQLFAQVILAILADLDLSAEQRGSAPSVVRRHLSALKVA